MFWSGCSLNHPRGVSQRKRVLWGMPMTLEELTGLVPGHGVGSQPAMRLGFRHDANRAVYHFGATVTGHVSSNLMEAYTARQVCSFACSAAPIADGVTVLKVAPGHPGLLRGRLSAACAGRSSLSDESKLVLLVWLAALVLQPLLLLLFALMSPSLLLLPLRRCGCRAVAMHTC